jgi:CrcB protein
VGDQPLRAHAAAVGIISGGAVFGATLRYGIELVIAHSLVATLGTNLVGCFLLGLLIFDSRSDDVLPRRLRLAFGTGFCSSFTTYSTFVLDAVTTAPALAAGYVLVSYAGGFAAVGLSYVVVDAIGTTTPQQPAWGDD